jgi:hypothetical protein
MTRQHDHHVAEAYTRSRERLVAYLMRCYPGCCRGRVEDAVATAFLQALERPAAFDRAAERGGTDELVSFMHLVARRQLRQDCRKKSFRSELHLDELPERLTADDPESRLRANELGARVSAKLDEATLLYGGRSKDKFRGRARRASRQRCPGHPRRAGPRRPAREPLPGTPLADARDARRMSGGRRASGL